MTPNAADQLPKAIVFDLFGTLVTAPSPEDRREAARELAGPTPVGEEAAEQVLITTWQERHDGRLPTHDALTDYLWRACEGSGPAPSAVRSALLRLASARLVPVPGVLAMLDHFRSREVAVGLLSDASADIAEAWQDSPLAPYFDVTVFSCRAGAVKPEPALYREVLEGLGTLPHRTLYCGDGGGNELQGALDAGMPAVRVDRRGGTATLAFGEGPWSGRSLTSVEDLPRLLRTGGGPC